MMLELEDFNNIISVKEKIKEEETKEQIEKKYIEQIQNIKKEYQQKLKEEVEKAYKKGFEEGINKANTQLKREYQLQLQEIVKEKESEIQYVLSKLKSIEDSLKERYLEYINNIREIILDSLSEILELLYIDSHNQQNITKAIETILLEFKDQNKIEIQVSETLYPLLKDTFKNVKKNPQLENDDFIIDFGDFQIENKVKEKLKIIKDEIKREIKKLTQV